MAKALDDAELWLPSQFVAAGEDALGDKENSKNGVTADLDAAFGFPSEFPYEFDSLGKSSSLSSPVESVAGSTETESSDEEDFFAGLTRRLSQTSLHESRKQLTAPICASDKAEKTRGLARSPQSTLSGIGSWSGRSAISGDGSPNGSSRVPSPPTTPFSDKNDLWEAIFAAAGQVARLKMNEDVSEYGFQNRGLLGFPRAAAKNPSPPTALLSNQSLARTPHHAAQVQHQQVRQELVLKQQGASPWGRQAKPNWLAQQQLVHNRGHDLGYEGVKCARPLSSPQSAWPPLQVQPQNQQVQHVGSRPRAVLQSSGSGVKRGCAGTGVFLPRQYGTPAESRRKTSCAPVLLPAKVVHALNSNIDDLDAASQPRFSSTFATDYGCAPVLLPAKVVHALNSNIDDLDAASQPRFSSTFATDYDELLARRNALLMQQRLSVRREEAANYEIRLPQEWTY